MGTDKALCRLGGVAILERVIVALGDICGAVYIVGGRTEHRGYGAELIADEAPGLGPLGGIATALAAFRSSHLFVVGCDMPFLSGELLHAMAEHPRDYTALVPCDGMRMHPLHAIYAPAALKPLQDRLVAGDLRVVPAVRSLQPRYLTRDWLGQHDPDLRSISNINTREELESARRLVGDGETVVRMSG